MAKAAKKKKNTGFFKFIKWFWILFSVGILSVVLLFLLASWGVFGAMPQYEYLENPQTNLATEIISSDGKTLGKFYLDDNRTPIPFDSLPDNLVNALIATEDARFYEHSGIDAFGVIAGDRLFRNQRRCQYDYTAVGTTTFCRGTVEEQIRDHYAKGNGMGIGHPTGKAVYQRRDYRHVPEPVRFSVQCRWHPLGGENLFRQGTRRTKDRRIGGIGGHAEKFILLQSHPKGRTGTQPQKYSSVTNGQI